MTESSFYKNAANYWAKIPATLNGVLGGYGHISDIDINSSKLFLNNIFCLDSPPRNNLALDCGAGIGRIAENLLSRYFKKVDLVEQDSKFIKAAVQLMDKEDGKLGTVYQMGLQDFKPDKKYDVIWCQWVLGHLSDYDLIIFLERCKKGLAANGVIVVKENISGSEELDFDETDSSVTRSYDHLKSIFKETNLQVIKESVQADFPEDLYPIHTFALIPVLET